MGESLLAHWECGGYSGGECQLPAFFPPRMAPLNRQLWRLPIGIVQG
jgi:hypothetical protein